MDFEDMVVRVHTVGNNELLWCDYILIVVGLLMLSEATFAQLRWKSSPDLIL